jgi:hypothetical protein
MSLLGNSSSSNLVMMMAPDLIDGRRIPRRGFQRLTAISRTLHVCNERAYVRRRAFERAQEI